MPFPVPLPTLIWSLFRPSLQPSWSSSIFPSFLLQRGVYGTRCQSGSFPLINVGSGLLLCAWFILFFLKRGISTHYRLPTSTHTSERLSQASICTHRLARLPFALTRAKCRLHLHSQRLNQATLCTSDVRMCWQRLRLRSMRQVNTKHEKYVGHDG